ncbi:hypothetical protein G7Y89_g4383 [Cudoniella acicularis]|uniref:Uncharacterized protein n=1 Tax=Cudoniella acicularis TaxID=354080 RepID=A0A8H4W4C3_9HELO|nr:hypothetical protein G7Y89_g4383 [Cudoniella acicularis]
MAAMGGEASPIEAVSFAPALKLQCAQGNTGRHWLRAMSALDIEEGGLEGIGGDWKGLEASATTLSSAVSITPTNDVQRSPGCCGRKPSREAPRGTCGSIMASSAVQRRTVRAPPRRQTKPPPPDVDFDFDIYLGDHPD